MASAPQIRVLFIIRALEVGGAERQLLNLAGGLAARGHAVAIAPMYAGGVLEAKLPAGVTLLRPAKQGRWDVLRFGRALLAEARAFAPTVVHGYMSGANEVALLLGGLLRCPVVYGIRVSTQPSGSLGTFRYRVFQVGCHLARWADRSIANSHAGRTFHVGRGYPADRCVVIPNGINTERFRPDPEDGARWRARHGYAADEPLILLPARLDPMKDHRTFLAAAARLLAHRPDVRLAAMGRGPAEAVAAFHAEARALGVDGAVRLLPEETAVESAFRGASLVTLTSAYGEGFPNVLGEAMASAVPCVATDCGDSAFVIGDTGTVVRIGDAAALADAWREALAGDAAARARRGAVARDRIVAQFSIEAMVRSTEQVLWTVMAEARRS